MAAECSALAKPDILGVVFDFVGAGHSIYVTTVCKRWRKLYTNAARVQQAQQHVHDRRCTTLISVFESLGRLHWARGAGLPLPFFTRFTRVPRELTKIEKSLCFSAGKYADIAILCELHKHGVPWISEVLAGAAASGSLEKLQCAHQLGFYWSSVVLQEALVAATTRGGTVETLQWLHEKAGGRISDSMRRLAVDATVSPVLRSFMQTVVTERDAACDSVGALQLLQLRCMQKNVEMAPYTVTHMRLAAEQGHLLMCMYLRSRQCPWDESVCEAATATDCADTLKWLHEHGCPWDLDRVCCAAASRGKTLVMEYLVHTVKVPISDLRRAASQRGAVSPKALKWLYDESERLEHEQEMAVEGAGKCCSTTNYSIYVSCCS
jgi:hypothetical protein